MQIVLGKFVHLFSHLWSMVGRGSNLFHTEDHLARMKQMSCSDSAWHCMMLPLCYTDLRASVATKVTCSDASEFGGGICISSGVTSLGRLRNPEGDLDSDASAQFFTIEWFAGIGGMSRSLERLGLRTHQTVVCENDENCLKI